VSRFLTAIKNLKLCHWSDKAGFDNSICRLFTQPIAIRYDTKEEFNVDSIAE